MSAPPLRVMTVAEHVYPFGTPCRFAGTGCGEDYCTCAETVGHFCPLECVTCAGDDRD